MVLVAGTSRLGALQREGPEAAMIDLSLSALSKFAGTSAVVLREPRMRTGFPDLILVKPSRGLSHSSFAELRSLSALELTLLHHVSRSERVCISSLGQILGWPNSKITSSIDELVHIGLATLDRDGEVELTKRAKSFVPRRIIAIEAKINDWQQAIHQASRNTWFSSESYVYMPAHVVKSKTRIAAARAGVGIIVFDGVRSFVAVKAAERALPVSGGSWKVANLVNQVLATMRNGNTNRSRDSIS